jgi:hypothetical protein
LSATVKVVRSSQKRRVAYLLVLSSEYVPARTAMISVALTMMATDADICTSRGETRVGE